MYHVKLHICLIGMPDEKLNLWQNIAAKPKFEHIFSATNDMPNILNPLPDANEYLIIVHQNANLPLNELRKRVGKNGVIVLYASDLNALQSEIYGAVDDVWSGENERADEFKFNQILSLIAERKEAWLQRNWLQTIINSLPDMIWFKDMQGIHLDVNDAFCEVVDKEKSDIRGKDHYYIWNIPKEIYEQSDYVCVQTEDDVIAARKTVLFDEEVMKADGNLSKLKTYKTPVFDGDTIIGTIGVARDVTHEYEYLQKIEHLAHYDQLTGLANRNQLDEFLSSLKTQRMYIVYMDLDRFKAVNDLHGHIVGDEALVAATDLIKEIFPDALNVRIGGDEFISIFTDGANMDNIPMRVQILIDRFFTICQRNPKFSELSISAGVAEGKINHGSFDLLLQRADAALYRAKHGGRGKYYVNAREDTAAK